MLKNEQMINSWSEGICFRFLSDNIVKNHNKLHFLGCFSLFSIGLNKGGLIHLFWV